MNGKQLKNSILQWAIQGKLVPQDPNDEPASVLLDKIRQEKERLIKEKKIKRDKNASIIYRGEDNSYYEKILATGEVKCIDEEIPFDVPNGWEWCRIASLADVVRGGSPRPAGSPIFYDGSIPFLKVADLTRESSIYVKSFSSTIKEAGLSKTRLVEAGTLLLTNSGATLGVPKICTFATTFNDGVAAFLSLDERLKLYVYWFFCYMTDLYRNINQGTAQPNLNTDIIKMTLVPIPPYKEQIRIIEQLGNISPIIEHYEKAQDELDELNESIPKLIKQSILQEAIRGKLVPQIAEEGTAKELLKQIKEEKLKLVKEGKLKKSALNDSVIFRGDDNKYYEQIGKKCLDITEQIPFDLPESWSWTRGMSVFMPMESTKPSSDFVYIDVDAVNNRLNIIDNPKKVRFENAPSRATRKLHKNDLLFSMVRPYLKNIALVDDTYIDAIASTGFYVITPSLGYYPVFLFYLMLSNYVVDGLNAFMKGDNSPSINNCHIEDYLYPLPPIEEQKRIVNKIEQLFKQLR